MTDPHEQAARASRASMIRLAEICVAAHARVTEEDGPALRAAIEELLVRVGLQIADSARPDPEDR